MNTEVGPGPARSVTDSEYLSVLRMVGRLRDFKLTYRVDPHTLVSGITLEYDQLKRDFHSGGVVVSDTLKAHLSELENLLDYARLCCGGREYDIEY